MTRLEPSDPRKWVVRGEARTRRIYVNERELTLEKSVQDQEWGKEILWGEETGASRQTALALLLRFVDPYIAEKLDKAFQLEVIKNLSGDEDWTCTGGEILDWIEKHKNG